MTFTKTELSLITGALGVKSYWLDMLGYLDLETFAMIARAGLGGVNKCFDVDIKHECSHRAMCEIHSIGHAFLFVHVCEPWEVAAYEQADHRDFEIMRKAMLQWRNYRRIVLDRE